MSSLGKFGLIFWKRKNLSNDFDECTPDCCLHSVTPGLFLLLTDLRPENLCGGSGHKTEEGFVDV